MTAANLDLRSAPSGATAGSPSPVCEGCGSAEREVERSDELDVTLCGECFAGLAGRQQLRVLLGRVVTFLRRYVVLRSVAQAHLLALWLVHTHAFSAAQATLYLLITSPEKGCGKTFLLELLEMLARDGWKLDGVPSEAVLFRVIDRDKPTTLFDEADRLFAAGKDRVEPVTAILNGGNRRGATVPRLVAKGKEFELRNFGTFCPKAFGGLSVAKWPDTVRDRGAELRVHRMAPGEQPERPRMRRLEEETAQLREELADWSTRNVERIRDIEPDDLNFLSPRAFDGWEPLLQIAEFAEGEWPKWARDAAREFSASPVDDDSLGTQLLSDIRDVFAKHGSDRIVTANLVDKLAELDEAPWGDWRRGEPITGRGLSKLLRPYGIRTRTVRDGEARSKGYALESFQDAFARYLRPISGSSGDTVTTASASQKPPVSEGDVDEPVTHREPRETASASQSHLVTPTRPNNGDGVPDEAEIRRLIAVADDVEREAAQVGLGAFDGEGA